MGTYLKIFYSVFYLFFKISFCVFLVTSLGCEPHKPRKAKAPIKPEDLIAKGEAKDLERTLDALLKLDDKTTVLSSKKCPKKVVESLPESILNNIECGGIKVPEDHREDTKQYMVLGYLKYPKQFDPQKPLLVIEQGGPGGSSMALTSRYLDKAAQLSKRFNILAIEQRGTNWTRPIATCDAMIDVSIKVIAENLESDEAKQLEIQANKNCLKKIKDKIDVSKISSYQISKDLVFSASQFGFSKFSFFGVSYGTLVGQYLLKYSNDSIENLVLDSPVVPGLFWVNDAVKNLDQLGKKNFKHYIFNQMKEYTFDEGVTHIKSAIEKFKANPVTIQLDFGEKTVNATIDDEAFLGLLFRVFISNYDEKSVKYLLWTSENLFIHPEEVKEILKVYAEAYMDPRDGITEIMYQSIICREFPTQTVDIISSTSNWKFIPSIIGENQMSQIYNSNLCYLDIPASNNEMILKEVVSSNKPVLIIGGELDHVTSPLYVESISSKMPNSHKQVFKGVGHGVFTEKTCIVDGVINYLLSEDSSFSNQCN